LNGKSGRQLPVSKVHYKPVQGRHRSAAPASILLVMPGRAPMMLMPQEVAGQSRPGNDFA